MQMVASTIAPGFSLAFSSLREDAITHFLPYLMPQSRASLTVEVRGQVKSSTDDDDGPDANDMAAAPLNIVLVPAETESRTPAARDPSLPSLSPLMPSFLDRASTCDGPSALGRLEQMDESNAGASSQSSSTGAPSYKDGPPPILEEDAAARGASPHLKRPSVQGTIVVEQDPLWLTFKDPLLECQFLEEDAAAGYPVCPTLRRHTEREGPNIWQGARRNGVTSNITQEVKDDSGVFGMQICIHIVLESRG